MVVEGKLQYCTSQRLLYLKAWHIHIELSYCFCLQQLFLSVLGAYVHGWVLLWQPGQICSLPGDGRARAGLSFLSLLPGKENCGFLCSCALCQPRSCSGHSAETLCCDFVLPNPKAVCSEVEDLHSGDASWFWHLLLLLCHLWFPVTISKVWCPHSILFTWTCCAGLGEAWSPWS